MRAVANKNRECISILLQHKHTDIQQRYKDCNVLDFAIALDKGEAVDMILEVYIMYIGSKNMFHF